MTKKTVTVGWGFSATEREQSDLEDALGVTILEKDDAPDFLESLKGKFVELFVGSGAAYGVYQGTTKDGAVTLKPAVFPGKAWLKKSEPEDEKYTWRNDPSYIRVGAVTGCRPLDEGTLRITAGNFDRVKDLGEYLVDSP